MEGLASRATTDAERTQLAITRASSLYWVLDLPAKADAVLRRARAAVSEPSYQEELALIQASFVLYGGRCADALAQVAGTLERPGASDRAVLQALLVAVPALFLDGHSDRAIAAAHRGVELARRLDDEAAAPWSKMQLSAYLGNAYLVSGRLDEAEALARGGLPAGAWAAMAGGKRVLGGLARTGYPGTRAAANGVALAPGGRRPPADAGTFPCRSCRPSWRARPRRGAARRPPRRPRKRWRRAEQLTARSARRLPAVGRISTPLGGGRPRGAVPAPSRSRWSSPNHARDRGQLTFQILALHDVARLGRPRQVDAMLRALVAGAGRTTRPRLRRPRHRAGRAERHRPRRGCERVREHRGQPAGGRGGRRGGTRVSRGRAPFERARREPTGRDTRGRRARALTRQRSTSSPRPPDLTPREQEIAGLAARGLSSRAIAERLVISVRTVDNALQHVYGKLGLTSRAELMACAWRCVRGRTVRVTPSRRRRRRVGHYSRQSARGAGWCTHGPHRGHRRIARGVRHRRSRTRRGSQQCRDRRTTRHRVRGRRTAPAPRGRETRRHPCRPRTVASNTRRHSRP